MLYIVIALVTYTAAILLTTAASRRTNSVLVTAIINSVATILPLIWVTSLAAKKAIHPVKTGVLFAIACGACISIYTLALNKSFSINKVGIVMPMVFGGAIFTSTILSYFIFKEKVTTTQALGLVLLALGFIVIVYAQATGK